ncbi:signal peptidase II [Devosia sp. BK]|uniref:signal peptidase II n=1 Tax=Devosia sp. BK TaxID=2871706 RepID=UPI00293A0B0C|nr:signal peptidase II [Devosia sp. BK]MDV3251782.1 signal peptidase II [Devosia sp. BK]
MNAKASPAILTSLLVAVLAFGIDRAQKGYHIAADCYAIGQANCVSVFSNFIPFSMTGWRGGEIVPVTPFFDYVLVWNTGISYGLLDGLPVWALGAIMMVAIVGLSIWWWRTNAPLVRVGLGFAIGGALSNALDRLIYGAVADFFHFHWGTWSFYIFNIADVAITLGVILLLLDALGVGRTRQTPAT